MTPGQSIHGRWEVLELLGQGGMGQVYKVRDKLAPNRPQPVAGDTQPDIVAAKVLNRTAWDQTWEKQFEREVHRARSVTHPNLVNVYDVHIKDPEYPCITMEFVNGPSLKSALRVLLVPPVGATLRIIEETAGALDALHSNGLLHLDVKPSNILLCVPLVRLALHDTKLPTLKLTDFGLLRPVVESTPERPGIGAGSIPYAAPEQLRADNVTALTDIHSLAALAYELLTGQAPPWTFGRNAADLLPWHPRLSSDLYDFLAKAMAFHDDDRVPRSMREFAATFKSLCESMLIDGEISTVIQMTLPHAETPSAGRAIELRLWRGVCAICKKDHGTYRTDHRYCCSDLAPSLERVLEQDAGVSIDRLFPTIMPVPIDDYVITGESRSLYVPRSPYDRPAQDMLTIAMRTTQNPGDTRADSRPPSGLPVEPLLSSLKCGNATLRPLDVIAGPFGFGGSAVSVLDMSTYPWSNTLKDPKSYVIVHTAIENGIRNLGLWTAGNAGISLARLVNAANCLLPIDKQISLYCFAERGELPTPSHIALRMLRADVVLSDAQHPMQIYPLDATLLDLNGKRRMGLTLADYWDVSDGWDGVGMYTYRLLARQLIVHTKPKHIIIPVGTGNMFLGFLLGLRDCLDASLVQPGDVIIHGAVPAGSSILSNLPTSFRDAVLGTRTKASRAQAPKASKLATVYTPLLLGLYHATKRESMCKIDIITRTEQLEAAKLLTDKNIAIAAEPSALVAFAALRKLGRAYQSERWNKNQRSRTFLHSTESVVVVNTGCGLLGKEEVDFGVKLFALDQDR